MAELSEGTVGIEVDEGFGVLEIEVAFRDVSSGLRLGVGDQYTHQIS